MWKCFSLGSLLLLCCIGKYIHCKWKKDWSQRAPREGRPLSIVLSSLIHICTFISANTTDIFGDALDKHLLVVVVVGFFVFLHTCYAAFSCIELFSKNISLLIGSIKETLSSGNFAQLGVKADGRVPMWLTTREREKVPMICVDTGEVGLYTEGKALRGGERWVFCQHKLCSKGF